MIEKVLIENFRGFRRVSVKLKPLTVLIGPNDTGKSSFLEALGGALRPKSSFTIRHAWKHAKGQVITIQLNDSVYTYDLKDRENVLASSQGPALNVRVQRFNLPSNNLQFAAEGVSDTTGAPAIDGDGKNLPAVLDFLLRRDRSRFFDFVNTLKSQVPGLQDVNITTPAAQTRGIEFVLEGGFKVDAAEASAGVKLLMFFVCLVYHPNPPGLILIEEPENGLHPRRLAEVVGLIKRFLRGDFGKREAQVVLTTHSPYLLDAIDPENDQILVFSREEDGACTAREIDRDKMREFLDHDFLPGEVWFNQGEGSLVAKGSG